MSTAQEFLSTPSARRATCAVDAGHRIVVRFLSTPSARRATVIAFSYAILQEFLSTPSARRATCHRPHCKRPCMPFLSTPSARRATSPHFFVLVARRVFLSTPSARRATDGDTASIRLLGISIHALRKEGDPPCPLGRGSIAVYFYPRPPQGGRPRLTPSRPATCSISIHALRKEGDCTSSPTSSAAVNFYPRPPQGGRPPEGLFF